MQDVLNRSREARLRRIAKRQGLALRRSRLRGPVHLDNFGGYRLVDPDRNYIVAGARWDLKLDDVERFLS